MKKIICALLAVLACLSFVACTPTSIEKAKEKMRKEGYNVAAYSNKEAEGCVGGFIAEEKGLLNMDMITALLFESSDAAKTFMEQVGDSLNAIRDGKWVYWGTEDAIEDFTD